MKQLYYGKPTRRFKIRRCMQFYLEKVKVNAKTVTHPLLMLRFLRVGDTRLTVSPSLPNGKNFFDSSIKYEDLVVKAQALAEKLSHLWSNVGCVIQFQENAQEGFIYITRTNVPTLDQLNSTKLMPTSLLGVDRETLTAFHKFHYKTACSLKRSLTYAFNKIEREASALVQEFLKEITHTAVGVALFKKMEKDEYDVAIDAVLSGKGIPEASLSQEGLRMMMGLHRTKQEETRKAKKPSKTKSKKSRSVSKEGLKAFFAGKRQGKKNKTKKK